MLSLWNGIISVLNFLFLYLSFLIFYGVVFVILNFKIKRTKTKVDGTRLGRMHPMINCFGTADSALVCTCVSVCH